MEKKTPLYDRHVSAGGKMVPFAGFILPVEYQTGVMAEHMAVREKAGLFDVSHMGEIILSGKDALANLNKLFSNDFTSMADGKVRYSPACNEQGGILDDLIMYRFNEDKYMLVPNAANREKDFTFFKAHLHGDVKMEDIGDTVAQLALQGPKSRDIMLKLTDEKNIPEKYYSFIDNVTVAGINCLISQTGYTGELGYELYCSSEDAVKLWDAIIAAGEEFGMIPCGLACRDTLRLEASMPLYGHEMTDDISPLEAGLGFAVKMQKPDFIGKAAIQAKGEPKVIRVGLKMTGRGIARENNPVMLEGKQIGYTTSGTHCPYLGGAYAMAMVNVENSAVGTKLQVEIRNRLIDAEIISMPFYKRSK